MNKEGKYWIIPPHKKNKTREQKPKNIIHVMITKLSVSPAGLPNHGLG